MPGGTVSPRLNFTRSLPSAHTLVAKSCDIATVPFGPGHRDRVRIGAEPARGAAPRRHVERRRARWPTAGRSAPRAPPSPRSRRAGRRDWRRAARPRPGRARAPARWPARCRAARPPGRSRRRRRGCAMVGVSTTSRICGVGLSVPALAAPSTYCGTRMTPCESWPRRLARTSMRGDPGGVVRRARRARRRCRG